MGKKKGFKFAIITLLVVLAILIFSVVALGLIYNFNKQKPTNKTSAAYTIIDGDSLRSNYNSYTEFTINSLSGLKAFASSVYSQSSGLNYSFSGKNVTLGTDIDCGGEVIRIGNNRDPSRRLTTDPVFAGVFNGNNKTISNFSLDSSNNTDSAVEVDTSRGASMWARGLFLSVSGTVQNLRLKTVKSSYDIYNSNFLQAAVVGLLNGGKVLNCSVEGFTGAYYACGIAATTYSATITNCYVSGVTNAPEYALSTLHGIGPCRDKLTMSGTTKTMSATISSCVTKGLTISTLSSTNCHSSANSTSGLSASSLSGTSGWYHHSDYNGGYPYLRQFMSWKDVTFTKGNGVSSFNPSSIKIPQDAYNTYPSSSNSITIYGQQVTAVRSSSYCNHASVSWTCNSATSYTANFNRPSRNVTINLKEGTGTAVKQTDFNVSCCNTITLQQSQPINSTTRIKEWKCTIGSYNYTAPSTHIISSIDGYSSGSKISANKTITINIARKTYNIQFK